MEQIILGSLIILYRQKADLILTIFIPIILGTASLRHIISNIKRRASEIEAKILYQEYNKWLDEVKILVEEIKELKKNKSKK
ncbi:MAG: hypothetical protein KKG75_04760 [Nanoarchaeota archaeon]|nr:hypothetical protein [Nanoarchaeota archaeon]